MSMLRTSALRSARLASTPLRAATAVVSQSRSASHAVSNVTLADIEKRWESMPPSEQADLWMSLRDRMKEPWSNLTVQEKKASYWVAFGPHGPRAVPPAGENKKILTYTLLGLGASFLLFYSTRLMARPPPKTLNREWEEASNEFLKAQNVEPITGVSSEGYTGKGQVQSK
ncbi:uncharacterized protein H6S33_011275 [Morchella sextelata]|uniref:uncharacterized protein n=1 Tax=Morchella sextelata TaxID=1174677 RepID=UPI001D049CA9|nr:uncharacterized protein H6S33_011275 [Morchella sextelata]KAH0610848.1 hypothetical protein H6S33_011275 [Morchella sextelata]